MSDSVAAQRVLLTPIVGRTTPQAGELLVWVQNPTPAGFDSSAYSHRFEAGSTYGILVELDRAGWLDFSAQLSANFARRPIVRDNGSERECKCNNSEIYGLAVLAKATMPVAPKLRVYAGFGPEFLYLSGDATTNDRAFTPPNQYQVKSPLVVGALGAVGVELDVTQRMALRLHGGYRYMPSRHELTDPTLESIASYSETAYQDLLLTVGLSRRLGR
ncbi:MAG: hypothetical protein KF689_10430 [Gemmatimonadaceae bacterium]|nr:hypothetical protein [Gemmatimonadaceae bacterium]MCW5825986.1 hypothetical protein [Gemmatimonadaceae bacterium]